MSTVVDSNIYNLLRMLIQQLDISLEYLTKAPAFLKYSYIVNVLILNQYSVSLILLDLQENVCPLLLVVLVLLNLLTSGSSRFVDRRTGLGIGSRSTVSLPVCTTLFCGCISTHKFILEVT